MKAFFCGLVGLIVITFSACSPDITLQAAGTNGSSLSFKTGFSAAAEQTLKSIISAISGSTETDAPLFSATDIITIMQSIGLQKVTATAPNGSAITTNGLAPSLSQTALATAGLITRTQESLTLTLGPQQFQSVYAMLDEESQAYFDLLMIPALSDEQMTANEYNDLLASVYGKTFADEITSGVFSAKLLSPDGKKTTTASLTVGELLTLTQEKRWTVTW